MVREWWSWAFDLTAMPRRLVLIGRSLDQELEVSGREAVRCDDWRWSGDDSPVSNSPLILRNRWNFI